ncbi:hypothetical protein MMC14_009695 [Varicellaria rhodocarpa]|nr:hypothetical protein [Varicellaria rhodocarpa]
MVESGDTFNAWVGPDKHFLATSVKDGRDFSWVCTHKDDADIKESWETPGKIEDALKILQGWDPVVLAIVRATPACVDWKVVYRDPLPTWISPKARIALIGDAAHPFLPTATQGASQAMEDGCTLAICFELAGKERIPEAVRAYQKIRYDRVRAAQKTGEDTRNNWHKSDHDRLASKPMDMKKLSLHKEAWLLAHDAEAHAYQVYPEIVKGLRGGMTNDPASVPKETVVDWVPMPMADTTAMEVT